MLAGILPGIRELRTPLAAGFVWLVGLWLLLEPLIFATSPVNPVVDSLGRLSSLISVIGLGVVVSFVAYLVGSLSASLLPWPPRKLADSGWLSSLSSPLSKTGRAALMFVAESARTRLVEKLSISGTTLADLLEQEGLGPDRSYSKAAPGYALDSASRGVLETVRGGIRRLASHVRIGSRSRYVLRAGPSAVMTGNLPPRDVEAEQRADIAAGIERDLAGLAITRLLGRDQELYSAVDRLNAESEFRGAIVPPLAFLGGIVAVNLDSRPWWAVVGTAIICAILSRDSIGLRRRSNDLLIDVVADGRIGCPTLDRLDAAAERAGLRTRVDEAEREASNLAAVLSRALTALDSAGRSEANEARDARDRAEAASDATAAADGTLLSNELRDAASTVAAQSLALAHDWVGLFENKGPIPDQEKRLAQIKDSYGSFIRMAKSEIEAMREAEASRE